MLKKTITYIDFNGAERTEDFYFNMSKHELAKLELSVKGGLTEYANRIAQAQDTPALINFFEDLIKMSYGVKTLDGRGFKKRPEDLEDFMATEAYSQLFMELATNAEAAAEFFNGIIPADMANQSTATN